MIIIIMQKNWLKHNFKKPSCTYSSYTVRSISGVNASSRLGGGEAPKGMGQYLPAPGEGSGRGKFFVISKWHILLTLRC